MLFLILFPNHSTAITNLLCQHLANGSAAIIYFTNTEKFGRTTAASQYFLQMAGFLVRERGRGKQQIPDKH